MIELYTWPTPNGHKVHIMLEETGTPYNVHAVDIGAGDQFKPDFLKISPNNRMPAIVDPKGNVSIFESGAILRYLAEKTGKFYAADAKGKLKYRESVLEGIENAPRGLIGLLKGRNFGKQLIKLA